jgi:sialic acid synthase
MDGAMSYFQGKKMDNFTLIAEIGCNHMGDMGTARKFIDIAHDFCGIHYVKFQKRNPRELLTEEQYNAPHPVPENAYGPTYGAHREALEFSLEQHRELKVYCDEKNVHYSSSVWDISSLREIMSLNPALIKIPSATNTHFELLELACREYPGEIHVSLGMTTRAEEKQIVDLISAHGRAKSTVLYACTSGYPIQPDEACLLEIPRLVDSYGHLVKAIGYSGHHNGIALDVAALTLGATHIERHFTLDRTWKGTDHAASLEPDGLRRLERNLTFTLQALRTKSPEILAVEEVQRRKLKWRSSTSGKSSPA